jgi:hypothetical protein
MPSRDHKTVYRAGYGIFYDRSGARPISEVKRFNGETIRGETSTFNSTSGDTKGATFTCAVDAAPDMGALPPSLALDLASGANAATGASTCTFSATICEVR